MEGLIAISREELNRIMTNSVVAFDPSFLSVVPADCEAFSDKFATNIQGYVLDSKPRGFTFVTTLIENYNFKINCSM